MMVLGEMLERSGPGILKAEVTNQWVREGQSLSSRGCFVWTSFLGWQTHFVPKWDTSLRHNMFLLCVLFLPPDTVSFLSMGTSVSFLHCVLNT